ncbi:hypothetical protein ACNQR7_05725 [Mycolicibacterium senegalense]|uniref:Lipoprotein n=1 Tax=Mycolicibacterium conceptionense TaxID=451644 RepID=A0A0U1DXT4_9MYCO|nr:MULTISPECIES: hypothetical protein [Mycolicibacterium]CQD23564.1 hypothetical protein BN970_05914 [Mycolicibacterium conceptionense]
MRRILAAAGAGLLGSGLLAGCAPVNEEAGKPVGHAYELLKYPDPAADPAAEPRAGSPFGSYPLEISGSVTYLDEQTPLPTSGVLTIGPGPRRGEVQVEQYYSGDRFPYETGIVSTGSDEAGAATLDAITIVNPLDSRVSLQCAVDGGIDLGDTGEPRELTGSCGGGAAVRGSVRSEGTRNSTWRGKPVELVRTVVDLDVTGVSTGTIHQVNETPKGGSFPLYTELKVDLTAQGIHLTEELERHVLPRVGD